LQTSISNTDIVFGLREKIQTATNGYNRIISKVLLYSIVS